MQIKTLAAAIAAASMGAKEPLFAREKYTGEEFCISRNELNDRKRGKKGKRLKDWQR